MHGAQNVFVLLDERPAPTYAHYDLNSHERCAIRLGPMRGCRRHPHRRRAGRAGFGRPLARMRIFNADGSEAEMCGNGVRCVARYLGERGAGTEFAIDTLAGRIVARIAEPRTVRRVRRYRVASRFRMRARRRVASRRWERAWRFYDVSLGNPHAVVFVPDVARDRSGRARRGACSGSRAFRRVRICTSFEIEDATTLRVRHFERGVGLTQACGTGAVASAVAAIATRGAHVTRDRPRTGRHARASPGKRGAARRV